MRIISENKPYGRIKIGVYSACVRICVVRCFLFSVLAINVRMNLTKYPCIPILSVTLSSFLYNNATSTWGKKNVLFACTREKEICDKFFE